MEITRVFDLLENLKKYSPKEDILARKFQGKWTTYSINDYIENSHLIAYALLSLGYKEGTKVISMCNNRPEWNFLDMGVTLAHMIHVPVYSTLGHDEYEFIFNHSDAEIIVVGNLNLYHKVSPVFEKLERKVQIIIMDTTTDMLCFPKLYEIGKAARAKFGPVVEENKKTISKDDVASIIYTSGTTGTPKGVMLSHYNLMFDSLAHAARQIKNSSHKMLSFLPLCHAYERTMNYEYQALGISIYYAESLGSVAADLADCHADGFCAVPRVLDMMYGKLEDAGKKMKGVSKVIYNLAWDFANNFDNHNKNFIYLFRQKIFDVLVYSKWRAALGGHEMLVVSGGSSIRGKIVKTFNAAKLYIFEGYGMTEASPVIAVNSPAEMDNAIGTVGKPLEGTELKFADDGEILTRGPHVMKGYYKNPEATAETIDSEGWLHTGDIGCFDNEGHVKITDRKKEIFKLSSGKYIAPQAIETMLKESSYIDNVIVIGENEKFASAIIIPSFTELSYFANRNHIKFSCNADLIQNETIVKLIHDNIESVNKKLAPHENIKKFKLVNDEWNSSNNMLSQTLKLKRRYILAKYESLIKDIYSNTSNSAD